MDKNIIEENKYKFIELLSSINREGANIQRLLAKLQSSDWFTAPASAQYHNSEEGGLVDHSLNVYYNLKSLVEMKHLQNIIPEESIIICGLLHDLSKMNLYEKYNKNVKKYHPYGKKHDNGGNYDWEVEESYTTVDKEKRFIYGSHEETAEFMVRQFIPLTVEESVAILSHMGAISFDSCQSVGNVMDRYERYPLATLLHLADMLSTYVDERK